MSVFGQSVRVTEGMDGCASGANDQKARCSAVITLSAGFGAAASGFELVVATGHAAPDLIHAASALTCVSESFGSLRGIFGAPDA